MNPSSPYQKDFSWFLFSLAGHAVLVGMFLISGFEQTPQYTIQSTVYFEQAPVKKRKKAESTQKKTAKTTTTVKTAAPAVKPVEKTEPEITKPTLKLKGFLRANKKTEDVQQAEATGESSSTGNPDEGDALGTIWKAKYNRLVYRNTLSRLVSANWKIPPTSLKTFQIIVETRIDRRGNIINLKVVKGAGVPILDSAAERAIRLSAPFPEFPSSFAEDLQVYRALFRFTPDDVKS